jgi:hypothetical protein
MLPRTMNLVKVAEHIKPAVFIVDAFLPSLCQFIFYMCLYSTELIKLPIVFY